MSIFKTAYQTTVGKGFALDKISNAIKELFIINNPLIIPGLTDNKKQSHPLLYIISGNISEKNTPTFIHPIVVSNMTKEDYLVLDMRSFIHINETNDSTRFNIKNISEYNLARARLAMGKLWLLNGQDAILGLSTIPIGIFSSWISEGVSHRFALTPLEQLQLAIISCFYYQSLFFKDTVFDEEMRNKFNSVCIRVLKAPANIVFETTEKITKLENITDFCSTIKTIIENTRITDFNAGLLITILKGSWFGSNAAEMLATSLEYPPNWVSIIYATLSERTYRNSNIFKLAEKYSRGGADKQFIKGFITLAKSVTDVDNQDDTVF